MIRRYIENVIDNTRKHFPVVLLTGPRQIGKSFLLYNSFIQKGYAYVSLDDTEELLTAKTDPKTFFELHPFPLIIDEAQKAPELFIEIERIVNESRVKKGNKASNGMFILSGSQRKKLLSEAEDTLPGRVAIIDMSNLSLNEILGFENSPFEVDLLKNSSRSKRFYLTEQEVFKYIARGFYPGLYDDLEMDSRIFYSSYISTYFKKDLKDFVEISDEAKFYSFLRLLASNTGEELVYDSYSKQIGVSNNTIKSWISTLLAMSIIYLVEPYNETSIVKRVVKRPKMYFFDTGLAAYLCGIDSPETLERSFLKGRFFETFVFNEIRKSYLNEGILQELFYYRDSDQNEVDLILLRDGNLSCVEIKSGKSFNASSTKSFKKLSNTQYQLGKNAIICNVDKVSLLNDGTLLLPFSSI